MFVHSAAFCCINFGNVGKVYSNIALSGKMNRTHPVYNHITRDELRVFKALNIYAKSIERLYEVFVQIDRDGSGEISVTEFFRFFSHRRRFPKKSKFAKRVFAIMDADGSGELDFSEFVIALWNFCTFTKPSLLRFSFELYDADGSGYLDAPEIKLILREVYGKEKYKEGQAAKFILGTVERMIESGSAGLNIRDFCEFCRHHPALLFPAFELQQALQQNVLGSQFWAQCAKRRAKRRGPKNKGKDAWTSTADMSINELNSFLESWRNSMQRTVEYDSDLEENIVFQTSTGAAIHPSPANDIDAEDDSNSTRRRSTTPSPTSQAPLKNGLTRQKKYAFQKLRNTRKIKVNQKSPSSDINRKGTPTVLKKTKPWTCSYCGRMNTHSVVCNTCQRKR